jgi:hypothetical protein
VHLAPQPARRSEAAPPPSRPSPPSPQVPSVQSQRAPANASAKAAQRAKPEPAAPRILTQDRPGAAAAPPSQSVPGDLASYIEARRRARESVQPPPSPARPPTARIETQQERDNRQAAENLGLNRTQNFGAEKKLGGGIFQVQRMGYDDAEFFFYGYNRLIRRNARQMIEVRRGDSPSMELAVVRKMIAIIREYTTEDFTWESQRLGREVPLSARPGDNAGLEDFMLSEFFPDYRRRR